MQHETDRLIPLLEDEDAPAVLAKAWRMVAFVHGVVCHWQETADALERGDRAAPGRRRRAAGRAALGAPTSWR